MNPVSSARLVSFSDLWMSFEITTRTGDADLETATTACESSLSLLARALGEEHERARRRHPFHPTRETAKPDGAPVFFARAMTMWPVPRGGVGREAVRVNLHIKLLELLVEQGQLRRVRIQIACAVGATASTAPARAR